MVILGSPFVSHTMAFESRIQAPARQLIPCRSRLEIMYNSEF
jgi:hypothetical protein